MCPSLKRINRCYIYQTLGCTHRLGWLVGFFYGVGFPFEVLKKIFNKRSFGEGKKAEFNLLKKTFFFFILLFSQSL